MVNRRTMYFRLVKQLEKRSHNRTTQSEKSNVVGKAYEQYPQPLNGDCKCDAYYKKSFDFYLTVFLGGYYNLFVKM